MIIFKYFDNTPFTYRHLELFYFRKRKIKRLLLPVKKINILVIYKCLELNIIKLTENFLFTISIFLKIR